MNKDERERLVKVEEAVKVLPGMDAKLDELLAIHHRQQGFITAGVLFLSGAAAIVGGLVTAFWKNLKALF